MKVIPVKIWNPKYSNIHNAIFINIYDNTYSIFFVKGGKIHNSKYPAEIVFKKSKDIYYTKYYCLFNIIYYDVINDSSWKKQAKKLIHQNKLKVFK